MARKLESQRSADQIKQLTEEVSELSRQQWEALRTWTFLGVTEQEHQAFADRRKRIGELAQIISGFKTD